MTLKTCHDDDEMTEELARGLQDTNINHRWAQSMETDGVGLPTPRAAMY